MTTRSLLTRRMVLKDMGKAGLAMMILGAAACTRESEDTPSTKPSETTTSTPEATVSTPAPGSTSSTTIGDGHLWHRVDLGFVSAYILYRTGEATIVDTGVDGSESAIEAALGVVGLGWGDVGGVIVTHLHPDHQGSLPAVLSATTGSLPWFAGAADLDRINAPTPGQAVGDGDTVDHGLQIIETPGHTAGHISVLDATAGVLVAGDALNGAEGGLIGANAQFSADMALADASVAKLAGFDYEVALFGHGEPVLSGAASMVADLAAMLGSG